MAPTESQSENGRFSSRISGRVPGKWATTVQFRTLIVSSSFRVLGPVYQTVDALSTPLAWLEGTAVSRGCSSHFATPRTVPHYFTRTAYRLISATYTSPSSPSGQIGVTTSQN